jgi:hypothetical protein
MRQPAFTILAISPIRSGRSLHLLAIDHNIRRFLAQMTTATVSMRPELEQSLRKAELGKYIIQAAKADPTIVTASGAPSASSYSR